ncbi:SLC13 family permease [Novipirellula sp. SH528]|uniref:SLC13 family permease n=1 Tax=Novipirellula sp. SH528 TaxID=3454466 RepID=UPI003F9F2E1A
MTIDIWIVTCVLLATIIAFVVDRFRLDVVAFVSLLALLLTGILTPTEATAGFSNSLVLMIAGLFVVGGAILESGVADLAGGWLGRVGGRSTIRLTVTVMLASALLSAFLSSTGTVAVMLPVVLSLCRRAKISPSKLLIQAISNTATSVLIAPLALELAQQLDVSPYPLLMGVALAASTAFSTPVASPINALVTGAGGYRFGDFLRVGVPLQLLILVATLAIVPYLFPFTP